jgi:hypothetical protein
MDADAGEISGKGSAFNDVLMSAGNKDGLAESSPDTKGLSAEPANPQAQHE